MPFFFPPLQPAAKQREDEASDVAPLGCRLGTVSAAVWPHGYKVATFFQTKISIRLWTHEKVLNICFLPSQSGANESLCTRWHGTPQH